MSTTDLRSEGATFRLSWFAPIPSTLFTVDRDADGITLLSELSDLEAAGFNPFQALYSDACDVGFVLRSERSGALVVYALEREIRHPETEELLWVFKPTEASQRRVPSSRMTVITIAND